MKKIKYILMVTISVVFMFGVVTMFTACGITTGGTSSTHNPVTKGNANDILISYCTDCGRANILKGTATNKEKYQYVCGHYVDAVDFTKGTCATRAELTTLSISLKQSYIGGKTEDRGSVTVTYCTKCARAVMIEYKSDVSSDKKENIITPCILTLQCALPTVKEIQYEDDKIYQIINK